MLKNNFIEKLDIENLEYAFNINRIFIAFFNYSNKSNLIYFLNNFDNILNNNIDYAL